MKNRHEMKHYAILLILDERKEQGVKRDEWQAVYRENILRSQLLIPLRTNYTVSKDSNGSYIGGAGASMLTPENQPILPSWYIP